MKKFIEISDETLKTLAEGKCVDGSLRVDKLTGKLTFRAFNRKAPKWQKDRVICQLENGWLKESRQRIKFFNSVRKEIGMKRVGCAMERELGTALEELRKDNLVNND